MKLFALSVMNLKIVILTLLFAVPGIAASQSITEINKTDLLGKKQGHWIKKYPNQNLMYDGYFKDDHPVGEFRRYNPDNTIKSLLIYSGDGIEALATIYHPNGKISSKGKFINQLKEEKWQFFSEYIDGYLICEEFYSGNLKNGPSVRFYPDKQIAEKLTYINDVRQGEWIQYYKNGNICLKANYLNGKMNGKFEVWFENGGIEFSGNYKNDLRDGIWYVYNIDGTVKYKLEYINGVSKDRQMDIDESDRLDFFERNKGKTADPEKTGTIW